MLHWIIVLSVGYLTIKWFWSKNNNIKSTHAIKQCAKTLLNSNHVIVDVETTGLSESSQIVEIAVIDTNGNVLLNTLVNPSVRISPRATETHQINKDMLKDAPRWPEVYERLNAAIGNKTIVAYNAEFEERLINQTCAAYQIEPINRNYECAMLLYAIWNGEPGRGKGQFKWKKLTDAQAKCKVRVNGENHRALTDCLVTMGVLKFISKK